MMDVGLFIFESEFWVFFDVNDEDNNNHFDEGKEISTIYKYKILFLIYYYTRSYQ